MAAGFPARDGGLLVDRMIRAIRENRDRLSAIDGAIGDGDHGINMAKGFGLCAERLAGEPRGLEESLRTLGRVLLMEIGGSMGPLYGSFFLEMAKAARGLDRVDGPAFLGMLQAGLAKIRAVGGAEPGDKTLLDVLVPAVSALAGALDRGEPFGDALEALDAASAAGFESTRDMVARVGRASRLGERSRGFPDAGAASCDLLLRAMTDGIRDLMKEDRA